MLVPMRQWDHQILRAGCDKLILHLLKSMIIVDALVYLILGLVGDGIEEQKVHYV